MTTVIKITDYNGEAALVFPEEVLKKLDVREGDQVFLTPIPSGFELRKAL